MKIIFHVKQTFRASVALIWHVTPHDMYRPRPSRRNRRKIARIYEFLRKSFYGLKSQCIARLQLGDFRDVIWWTCCACSTLICARLTSSTLTLKTATTCRHKSNSDITCQHYDIITNGTAAASDAPADIDDLGTHNKPSMYIMYTLSVQSRFRLKPVA